MYSRSFGTLKSLRVTVESWVCVCVCVSEAVSQSNGFVQPSVAVVLPLNDPTNWSESPIAHARAHARTHTNIYWAALNTNSRWSRRSISNFPLLWFLHGCRNLHFRQMLRTSDVVCQGRYLQGLVHLWWKEKNKQWHDLKTDTRAVKWLEPLERRLLFVAFSSTTGKYVVEWASVSFYLATCPLAGVNHEYMSASVC